MTTLREQVAEFHRAVGQPLLESPTIPAEERVRLRARLMAEEFFETMVAMFSRLERRSLDYIYSDLKAFIDVGVIGVDLPELVDGLADLDYVVEGTRLEFGVDGGPIAAEVHRANMAKSGGNVRADGKILKPEGWKPPDIPGELLKQRRER
jgi:predicted HAD superfamily Cof-like phosphohydrolase